jgi:hypothetical protein
MSEPKKFYTHYELQLALRQCDPFWRAFYENWANSLAKAYEGLSPKMKGFTITPKVDVDVDDRRRKP